MCDISDGFKLCTCVDSDAAADWVLRRMLPTDPFAMKRGRFMQPKPDADDQRLQATLLAGLQRGDCFDFDYQPVEGDHLTFHMTKTRTAFVFRGGAWAKDVVPLSFGPNREVAFEGQLRSGKPSGDT